MNLTQDQINVLKQNLRHKRLKLEILTRDFKVLDSIEGYAIGGSITVSADSPTRRSGSVTLAIPLIYNVDSFLNAIDGLTIDLGGKIWLDKDIRIYVGIDDINSRDSLTPNTIWYNLGIFLIDQPTRSFSATDFSLSFQCIDLMARYTGIRQGQLTDLSILIPQGEYVTENGELIYKQTLLQEALTSVITDIANIQKFSIYPIPQKYKYLPYDIKISSGATIYDLLNEFISILSTWQMYFDVDGTFIIEPIPSGEQDILYDINVEQLITDNLSIDFQNVKNQIIIYGKLNELNYFTNNINKEWDVTTSFGDPNTTITLDEEVWSTYTNENINNGTLIWGATDGESTERKWSCSWDNSLYSTERLSTRLGITINGANNVFDTITINYTMPETNVSYTQNTDNTLTLNLNYSALESTNFTIGGTTFGFQSIDEYNTLPISKVKLTLNGEDFLESDLVYYENTNKVFGIEYPNSNIPTNIVLPNNIYFLKIYSATLNEDKTINLESPITFEYVGQQQSSYCLVDDNLESPFYINYGLNTPNFYCGFSYTPSSTSETMQLTLNNQSPINTLENGTILTFMADRTYNGEYKLSILSAENTNILQNVPIVSNRWVSSGTREILPANVFTNNYTIIELRYEANTEVVDESGSPIGTGSFVYLGTAPTVITLICSGGEYDNISSDQWAYERSLYELFIHSNLNDTIQIGIVPDYTLDVNCRIPYNEKDSMPIALKGLATGDTQYFLIKQLTFPLGLDNSSQTITAARIYDSGNLMGSDYE